MMEIFRMKIYNVPLTLVDSLKTKEIIVRSPTPTDLLHYLSEIQSDNLIGIQLLSVEKDNSILSEIELSIPIELNIDDPSSEYSKLYNYVELSRRVDFKVSIKVKPDFEKAVKVALSLGYQVKLEVGQPDDTLVNNLIEIFKHYLSNPTVTCPVEFFHSVLIAFFHKHSTNIWEIQDEDPSSNIYIKDNGQKALSMRLNEIILEDNVDNFLDERRLQLLIEQGECATCRFFTYCIGYFKIPDNSYRCNKILELFDIIKTAADQLRLDLQETNKHDGAHE